MSDPDVDPDPATLVADPRHAGGGVDPVDADEVLDLDLVEPEVLARVEEMAEVHDCRDGWLEPGPDDQPRPCLLCRPWLATRTALYTTTPPRSSS